MLGIAAAVLAIPAVRHLRETPLPETRLDIVTPATDDPALFALSPDGRQIVFVAKSDGAARLWLRSLAKATALPLAGTEGATNPFWSPDSQSIGFFVPGSLKRLDLDGGQAQTLAPTTGIGTGSWSSKGVILFSSSSAVLGPLSRVGASAPAVGQEPGRESFSDVPARRAAFMFESLRATEAGTYLGSLDGAAVRLTSDGQAAYLPAGWLLWVRTGGTLVAQRLDLAKGALVGETVSLADGVLSVSASTTGVVAYRVGGSGQRQLTWVDRSGAVRGTVGPPDGSLSAPRVSPDGLQVAFSRETRAMPTSGCRATRAYHASPLEVGPANFRFGRPTVAGWPSDRGRVQPSVFTRSPPMARRRRNCWVLSQHGQYPTSWSADGRYLLYFSFDPGPNPDLWVLPMTGTRKPFPFLQLSFLKGWGQFSPDDRWVAYQSGESGRMEIYVRRFVGSGDAADSTAAQAGQWQVSTAGGISPTWRADGKELYYIDPAGMMMAAPITQTGSTVVPGTPVTLFQTNVVGGGSDSGQGRQYDVAPDGRFMINRVLDSATAPITLILNWNPDATKQ